MQTYVVLLRGVNVGGRTKVAMPALRELLAGLGLEDVTTYIQSGNVVLRSPKTGENELAARIEKEIERSFGTAVTVVLRTPAQLARIVRSNPFLAETTDASKLHLHFLKEAPKRAAVAALDPEHGAPDRFRVKGREVYLLLPDGLGRSRLSIDWFERKLGVRATARNWKTVNKLLELSAP